MTDERHLKLVQGLREKEREREALLKEFQILGEQMDDLRYQFYRMMSAAKEAGISATRLANAVGKTEASVRMYWKRKGIS